MFLKLVALGLTALILVPSGGHLFELPGKINLSREAYFTVQQIYAGWAWFAVAIGAAILANGALFVSEPPIRASSANQTSIRSRSIPLSREIASRRSGNAF